MPRVEKKHKSRTLGLAQHDHEAPAFDVLFFSFSFPTRFGSHQNRIYEVEKFSSPFFAFNSLSKNKNTFQMELTARV
jgi:hypothetical protein